MNSISPATTAVRRVAHYLVADLFTVWIHGPLCSETLMLLPYRVLVEVYEENPVLYGADKKEYFNSLFRSL